MVCNLTIAVLFSGWFWVVAELIVLKYRVFFFFFPFDFVLGSRGENRMRGSLLYKEMWMLGHMPGVGGKELRTFLCD